MFGFFPEYFRQALHQYAEKIAKDRSIFLKTYNIYPLFEGEKLQQVSFAIVKLGISNENYSPIPQIEDKEISSEKIMANYIMNYKGLCEHSQKIQPSSRLNYKSPTMLVYSNSPRKMMTEAQDKAIAAFERPIIDLHESMKIPEPARKRICELIQGVGHHKCNYCISDSSSAKESDKDDSSFEVFLEDKESSNVI
ncbi:uncharacterized protein [Rutidosis leptorrhynchoides]|uniref:uncharacterized protein n=1 Tax=Rutidosis leptorrhynchoides TaxID=125765 RepID=UPI003A9A2ED8